MRNVLFVAPFLMETTLRFVDTVRTHPDCRCLGLVQRKPEGISAEDRARFHDVIELDDCFNPDQVEWGAREFIKKYGAAARIVNVLEHIQEMVAEVRSRLGLPGLSREASRRFLNKSVMKTALRGLGLPCARHKSVTSLEEGVAFAREVGFPVVMKPPVGAGCISTFMINNEHELYSSLIQMQPSGANPVQAEEFITGEEFSFDTITIDNEPKYFNICQYLPPPLEAMRNPWIQWTYLLPREIDGPEYDEARRVGFGAVRGLGMTSGVTHMEWFRRRDGSVAIGEVAARPPGANLMKCLGLAHDTDFFRIWAEAVLDNRFRGVGERKFAVGVAFLRGPGAGQVCGVDGVTSVRQRLGRFIVEERLPRIGAPKSEAYEGDGYIIVKDPSTQVVREVLSGIISTIRVFYA